MGYFFLLFFPGRIHNTFYNKTMIPLNDLSPYVLLAIVHQRQADTVIITPRKVTP